MKAKFRIKKTQRGFITLYQAQIKKWYGWKSFWTSSNGITYNFPSPSINIQTERESIDNYIAAKGWYKHQVSITKSEQ